MDPKSENFICPGNIYRLLAVLHPGILGWVAWFKLGFKALICAYMQLYLPFTFIRGTLAEWHLKGIKSPIWFMNEAFTFATMFAALASVCNLFQNKCANSNT